MGFLFDDETGDGRRSVDADLAPLVVGEQPVHDDALSVVMPLHDTPGHDLMTG